MKRAAWVFLAVILSTCVLQAHEVRPAYLELRQQTQTGFDALWKVPAMGEMRLGLYVVLPDDCKFTEEPRAFMSGGAFVERWSFTQDNALVGDTIYIEGLERTMTDVLVRMEWLDGSSQVQRITPSKPWMVVPSAPTKASVIITYLELGIEHILLGIDHLLFVLALLLIVDGVGKLVKTITAFTIAHSITLAAAALGVVNIPGPPVEAVIALSIAFVAVEIIRKQQGPEGITARAPWIVAFTFGLLHGFGFAGALFEIGLPEQAIPLSLLFFNVGVEVGQLAFVAVVLAIQWGWTKSRIKLPTWSVSVPPYVIGGLAMFWVIERVAGFWN